MQDTKDVKKLMGVSEQKDLRVKGSGGEGVKKNNKNKFYWKMIVNTVYVN